MKKTYQKDDMISMRKEKERKKGVHFEVVLLLLLDSVYRSSQSSNSKFQWRTRTRYPDGARSQEPGAIRQIQMFS